MKIKEPKPPSLAQQLLVYFLRSELVEEVTGDLDEKFYSSIKVGSVLTAKLNYWYQVINYIRPFAIRKSNSTIIYYPMFKNYFKISWRNILKNRTYSFINIFGLSIGLACCMAIGLYVWDEYSYDRFHTNGENIYRVVEKQNQAGIIYDIAATPAPLANGLKTDFAEIQKTCRIRKRSGFFQIDQTNVEPKGIYAVDNSFFSMFNFNVIKGNAQNVLLNPNEVIITKNVAEQIFGAQWEKLNTVLGSQITFNDKQVLTLVGIAENPPVNSHLQFDVLLSFSADELNQVNLSWGNNSYHTYISLNSSANADHLDHNIRDYLIKYRPDTKTKLLLQPLHRIYLHSKFAFSTDWNRTSSVTYIYIFLAVGLVILIIAISNFINLSIARATHRAKEVGIRKVTGASIKQIVTQFLSESLMITFFAVCLAFLLLQIFLPILNEITAKSLSIPIQQPYFIAAICISSIFIGFLAGIYPAFYLSAFNPIKVLKGFLRSRSGQLFRHSLVAGQFMLSAILIVSSIVIYKQLSFLQHKDLGFDQSQLVYVRMKNKLLKSEMLLKEDLQRQTCIASVASSSNNLIDITSSTTNIEWEGQLAEDDFLMTQVNVDPDFLPTTGMTLLAGRNFDKNLVTDSSSFIINETAAKRMGWSASQALGKTVTMWDVHGTVIGVVKDFHFRPMTELIEPFLFRYWSDDSYGGLLVKTIPGQTNNAVNYIEELYKKYENQTAVQYEFIDQTLNNQYHKERNTAKIILYFSILAIFVACLGLFGLTTYVAEQRIKEISIRKVLGASVVNILNTLSLNSLKPVFISIIVALPLAWYSMNMWLQNFSYRISIAWWMLAAPVVIIIGIAFLTISVKSIKAALVNPVNNLRSE